MKAVSLSDPGRRKLRNVLQALVVANLVLWGCVGVFFYAWQASVLESSRRDQSLYVSNLAQGLSQTINAELTQVDLSLKQIAYQLTNPTAAQSRSADDIERMLRAQQDLIPLVDALRLTDNQGNIRYGYGNGADRLHPVKVDQQPIFQQVRDSRDSDLLVSEPYVSPITKRWVLTLARRLQGRDGSFSGMLYATVGSDHFADLFSSVQLGNHGAISLRTASLQLVARVSADQPGPAPIGSQKVSTEFAQALKLAPLFGVYASPTALDGIERLNAYSRVLNFPLLVIAGQGLDVYQGPWLRQSSQIALLCLLCVLALALMSLLAYSAMRRELATRDAMEHDFLQSRSLIDASSDGVYVLDQSGVLLQSNAIFPRMLGYREDFLIGRPLAYWTDLPLDALTALAPQTAGQIEARYRKADGTEIEVEVRFVQRSAPGQERQIYCSARDITARKAAEHAMRRERGQMEAIGQASSSAFLLIGQRGDHIGYFNHRFCLLWQLEHLEAVMQAGKLGYSQVLLAMRSQLRHPEQLTAALASLEHEDQRAPGQIRLVLHGGRAVQLQALPVHAGDQEYIGRLYVFDEVSGTPEVTR